MAPGLAAHGGVSPERAVPPPQDAAVQPHPVLEPPPPLPAPNGFSNTVVQIHEGGNGEEMDEDIEDGGPEPATKATDWGSIEPYEKLMALVGTSIAEGKGKGEPENAEKKEEARAQ